MTKKERYAGVIAYFEAQVPIAETELVYNNPFELLVAVILSAQCTDKRVNLTTPSIFAKFPTPQKMAKASFDDMFALIKSISYPSNKSKHLIGMANLLLSKFGGEVPMTVDELVELPGVGRKTANVITSVIDQQPNMAVDTHVFRVSKRIDQKYPFGTGAQSAPLAHITWQVYMPGTNAKMRQLWATNKLPLLQYQSFKSQILARSNRVVFL
jgi:endonuclease-3